MTTTHTQKKKREEKLLQDEVSSNLGTTIDGVGKYLTLMRRIIVFGN